MLNVECVRFESIRETNVDLVDQKLFIIFCAGLGWIGVRYVT